MISKKFRRMVDEAGSLDATIKEGDIELSYMKDDLKEMALDKRERKLEGLKDWNATVSDSSKNVMDMGEIWKKLINGSMERFIELANPNIKALKAFCDKAGIEFSDFVERKDKEEFSRIAFRRKPVRKKKKPVRQRRVKGRAARIIDL